LKAANLPNRMGLFPIPLKVKRINAFDLKIEVPLVAPDKVDSIVELNCSTDIQTDTNRLLQPEFPSDTLRAFDGQLHGGLKFGPGKKTDDVAQNWSKTNQFITWPVRLNEAATYDVFANYDAGQGSVSNAFTVSFGAQTLGGTVQASTNRSISLGRVSLKPGTFEIKVIAKEIKGGELFSLRNLELRPVSQ